MKAKVLAKRVILTAIPLMLLMAAMIFIPAGTIDYWQGWLFLSTLFIPMFFVFLYMLRRQKKLLEKRLNVKEKRSEQKLIQLLNTFVFFCAMVIAGLDHRYGWSTVPLSMIIAADIVMLTGYLSFIRTMVHNEYASRVIEVQKGQKVIDTGPYAVVRHPLYVAGILMYMFIPIVLGSYWAMIPLLAIPVTLVLRLLDEEKMLINDLKGYKRYMKKVKYRLIPYVW